MKPLPLLADKPKHGEPCNGCGLCCLSEQCRVSVERFGPHPVCPALESEHGRYWCGLMRSPSKYGAIPEGYEDLARFGVSVEDTAARFWRAYIGGGMGCDSEDP